MFIIIQAQELLFARRVLGLIAGRAGGTLLGKILVLKQKSFADTIPAEVNRRKSNEGK